MSKIYRPVFLALGALSSVTCAQFTLTGPGGTFGVGEPLGFFEPVELSPVGGDNVLHRNNLIVEIRDEAGFLTPAQEAYSRSPATTVESTSEGLTINLSIIDLEIEVTTRSSTPADGPLPSTDQMDYFLMDVSVTNSTNGELQVDLIHHLDFDLDLAARDEDRLTPFDGPDFALFRQSNANNPFDLVVAMEQPASFGADEEPGLFDQFFRDVLFIDSTAGPLADWAFAFQRSFFLGAGATDTHTLALGFVPQEGGPSIPEPSELFIFAGALIALLGALRRRP